MIGIDEAHHNFHTRDGRYSPFAALLSRDGYRVVSVAGEFESATLAPLRLLVVANAVAAANETNWARPISPAFRPAEVEAARRWVEAGGALLLIADHMPFGGAMADLGRAFGFELADGFTLGAGGVDLPPFTRVEGTLLDHAVTRGPAGRVERVLTFTGQAFGIPPEAVPLLVVPEGAVTLLPDTAWQFSDATRRVPAGGLAQGAVRRFGQGRVAVFGEAAMFTAQLAGPARRPVGMNAPGAEGNIVLLRNLVAWLTGRD